MTARDHTGVVVDLIRSREPIRRLDLPALLDDAFAGATVDPSGVIPARGLSPATPAGATIFSRLRHP